MTQQMVSTYISNHRKKLEQIKKLLANVQLSTSAMDRNKIAALIIVSILIGGTPLQNLAATIKGLAEDAFD